MHQAGVEPNNPLHNDKITRYARNLACERWRYALKITYGGSMNNYDEMYRKFDLSEEDRIQFKVMSDTEYSRKTRIAMLSVETTVNNDGNEHIENKEVINAKLV